MKKIMLLFLFLTTLAYSEIKVKIIEPIRVEDKKINITASNTVVAKGKIKVFSSNKEEKDDGKTMIVIRYSRTGVLSTSKSWIKTDDIKLTPLNRDYSNYKEYNGGDQGYISFIWKGKDIFFDLSSRLGIDRIKNLSSREINGIYKGRVNLNVEVYTKDDTKADRYVEDTTKKEFARKHKQYYEKYKENWKKLYTANKPLFTGASQHDIDLYVYALINDPSLLNKTKQDFKNYIQANKPDLLNDENKDLNKLHEYIQNDYDKKINGGS